MQQESHSNVARLDRTNNKMGSKLEAESCGAFLLHLENIHVHADTAQPCAIDIQKCHRMLQCYSNLCADLSYSLYLRKARGVYMN